MVTLRILWCMVLVGLSGCGYRFVGTEQYARPTLGVPYVEGDRNGFITSALIREICNDNTFQYVSEGGEYTLKVKVIDLRDENIGFRYYRKQSGKLTNYVVPTETRLWVATEVSVIDNSSGEYALEPVLIETNADFDHDYYLNLHGINIFSLGQLSDVDSAREDVWEPLNKLLSQKIVSYVSNSW